MSSIENLVKDGIYFGLGLADYGYEKALDFFDECTLYGRSKELKARKKVDKMVFRGREVAQDFKMDVNQRREGRPSDNYVNRDEVRELIRDELKKQTASED